MVEIYNDNNNKLAGWILSIRL